jgi:hypothetical protein
MPEASRHAKPKPTVLKLRASILAAAALAGVAAAFVIFQGGATARTPARHALPAPSTAAAYSGSDLENAAAVRHEMATMAVRVMVRNRAAASRRHRAALAALAARQAQQQAAQRTQLTDLGTDRLQRR